MKVTFGSIFYGVVGALLLAWGVVAQTEPLVFFQTQDISLGSKFIGLMFLVLALGLLAPKGGWIGVVLTQHKSD